MRRFAFFFTPLALSVAVLHAACVSDSPVTPDDAGSESSTGSETGAEGGAPVLACGLVTQSPTPVNLGPVGQADSGVPTKIDKERFSFVRLPDGNHVTILAPLSNDGVMNPSGTQVLAYTFDLTINNDQGTKAIITVPSYRIVWTGAVNDGIGILAWEKQAQEGFTVYKVTASELLAAKNITATQSQRVDILTNPQVTFADSGGILTLMGMDDYFLLGVAGPRNGTQYNVTARLKGNGAQTAVITPKTVDGYLYAGMTKVGAKVHVSSFTGSMASVMTNEIDYDINTAGVLATTPVPNAIFAGAVPAGNEWTTALLEGDLSTATIKGLRIGNQPVPSALAGAMMMGSPLTFLPFTTSELGIGGISYLRWWTYDQTHPPTLLVAGPTPMGGGANFIWVDGKAVIHARATGANAVLKDKGTIGTLALVPFATPTDTQGRFQVAYVTNDANGVDNLAYGQIACSQ